MNEYNPSPFASISAVTAQFSPFLLHYIILTIVILFILCVCVLKFNYLYWYSQPLTFRFTARRFGSGRRDNDGIKYRTNVMNRLSLAERCYNAVVYPFLHHVNHESVRVYRGTDEDTPFDKIAELLERADTKITIPGPGRREMTLRLILSQDTFGLSAFIGVIHDTLHTTELKGVSILTPRIMNSFGTSSITSPYRSVTIYMCDYLAWGKYTVSERVSLELLETTEYIQKSREIAGEQTLYRYREIPWFVVPFTTVFSYTFSLSNEYHDSTDSRASTFQSLGNGMRIVPVSSTNFALFYSFINECSRDFHCTILNELTQLQSLTSHGMYRIYMMLVNNIRVAAVYIFAPSMVSTSSTITKPLMQTSTESASADRTPRKINKKITKGNRIDAIHDYVSNTSTALVKYLPPVISPKYDAFGKRIKPVSKTTSREKTDITSKTSNEEIILRLISSIQHKTLCDNVDFVKGFKLSISHLSTLTGSKKCVMIDTFAHNYRIIDTLLAKNIPNNYSWRLLSQDKWYYILYNAIIHDETMCKDILLL